MLPTRILGRTNQKVTMFGLGGEGILRTTGQEKGAIAVIRKAFEVGVTYFDTAPAYQQSRDYLGAVFGSLGNKRHSVFLASKTHDRSYEGSMQLLDDTLKRLKTDYLDLWQLHDLRTKEDLDEIFSANGAIHALEDAKKDGRVRFIGITGHYDPAILIAALKKYQFDTLLVCCNAGDSHHLPFITSVIPEARKKGMGVIAMKVAAAGYGLAALSMKECMQYALSQSVDLCIVGCKNPGEVVQNAKFATEFDQLSPEQARSIEQKTTSAVQEFNFFKRGMS